MGKEAKKEVNLIISDIDNTIADFFDTWSKSFAAAVAMLSASRGISEQDIYEDIKQNTPPTFRFSPNVSGLIKNTPILQPKNEEEQKRFLKDDAKIIHKINKMRARGDKAYTGVIATLKKAKKQGAKVVLYTDSPLKTAVGRLANMDFPVELLDGLYTRKDDGSYEPPLFAKGKFASYWSLLEKSLGSNIVEHKDRKPNLDVMNCIMKSVGVSNPKRVVMVGDSIKSDGGSGIGAGCEFAWAKYGAKSSENTRQVYQKINDKGHVKFGIEANLEQINDGNRPSVVLENGFMELSKHYSFVSPDNNKELNKSLLLQKASSGR
ncbi:MAG: HAD family hydrolase [Alphaproteobacteria bacterium]